MTGRYSGKMKRRKLMLFVGLFALLIILAWGFTEINKLTLKSEVSQHLTKMGYSKDQIASIRTYFGKMPLFSARVVFSDENVVYYYRKDPPNKIRQFGTPTDLGGHILPINYSFKHIEPVP
jgi:hypothetical protein